MSRSTLFAIAALLTAAALGLGYLAGISRESSPQPVARVVRGDPLPPDGVAAAVAEALTKADPLERTAELAKLLHGLGPEALADVQTAFDAVFVDWGDVEVILLAEWWARFDPEAAFEWTRREAIGRHPSVVTTALRAWAARDPEAARQVVEAIPSPDQRRGASEALIRGWEAGGQPGLMDYVANLPFGVERQTSLARMARRKVMRDGVEATFRWAEQIPDDAPDRFKLQAYRRAASAVADVDPQAAAAWAERHSDGEYGDGLYRRVGDRWAKRDGNAAMAWLAGVPAGRQRDIGVQETFRSWLAWDRESALAWMRGGEVAAWREPAVALFAVYTAAEQPEEALDWAARIVDAKRREETIAKIGVSWRTSDPEAARAWLDRAELSEETRRRINQPLPPPRGRNRAGAQAEAPAAQ